MQEYSNSIAKIFYTTRQVAEIMNVSRWTIYRFVREGIIHPTKVKCAEGKQIKHCRSYFLCEDVIRLIDYLLPSLDPLQKKSIRDRLRKK